MKSKKLALCALLTALGLTLSYAENFLPLTLFVPIPGLKLGLSNTVTLAALYLLGGSYAATISFARCFLGAFYASGLTSLWFSLCGAVMSLIIMWMLKTYASRITSAVGRFYSRVCRSQLWADLCGSGCYAHMDYFCLFACLADRFYWNRLYNCGGQSAHFNSDTKMEAINNPLPYGRGLFITFIYKV